MRGRIARLTDNPEWTDVLLDKANGLHINFNPSAAFGGPAVVMRVARSVAQDGP